MQHPTSPIGTSPIGGRIACGKGLPTPFVDYVIDVGGMRLLLVWAWLGDLLVGGRSLRPGSRRFLTRGISAHHPHSLSHAIRVDPPSPGRQPRTRLNCRCPAKCGRLGAVTGPSFDDSTGGREKARSAAGVIVTRLLAVLVVAMVVTSILGFTLFDRQGGNSATALASLAIGGSAAALGLILGFREAHHAS